MFNNITDKVFLTRTQEQHDWLLEKLEEKTDIRWNSGTKPTEENFFYSNGEQSVLLVVEGFVGDSLMFGSQPFAIRDYGERDFIEVSDLMEEENAPKFKVVLPDPESPASATLTCLRTDDTGKVYISKVRKEKFFDNAGGHYSLTAKQIRKNHEYLWNFAEFESEEPLFQVFVEDGFGNGFYLRWSEVWESVTIEDLDDYHERDITKMTERQIKGFKKSLWDLAKPAN